MSGQSNAVQSLPDIPIMAISTGRLFTPKAQAAIADIAANPNSNIHLVQASIHRDANTLLRLHTVRCLLAPLCTVPSRQPVPCALAGSQAPFQPTCIREHVWTASLHERTCVKTLSTAHILPTWCCFPAPSPATTIWTCGWVHTDLPFPNRILKPNLHAQVPGTKPSDDQLDLVIGSTYDGLRGNRYESASSSDIVHSLPSVTLSLFVAPPECIAERVPSGLHEQLRAVSLLPSGLVGIHPSFNTPA